VRLEAQPFPPPSPELRALFRSTLEGPVLDVPPCYPLGFGCRAHSLLLAAYHEHPIAWGWGSYLSPLAAPVERLADRLPAPDAADALHALGFRSVVVHRERLGERAHPLLPVMPSPGGRLQPLGEADGHVVYRLTSPLPITTDVAALVPVLDGRVQQLSAPGTNIVFNIRNAAAKTFRHPDPIEPSELAVRWGTLSGRVVGEQRVRALLPPALGVGGQDDVTVALDPPPGDGEWLAMLTLAEEPIRRLGLARVRVARE
jgi:hypothetical protein